MSRAADRQSTDSRSTRMLMQCCSAASPVTLSGPCRRVSAAWRLCRQSACRRWTRCAVRPQLPCRSCRTSSATASSPPPRDCLSRSGSATVGAQAPHGSCSSVCCRPSPLTVRFLASLSRCALLRPAVLLLCSEAAELEETFQFALDDAHSAQAESLEELRDRFSTQTQTLAEQLRLQKQRMKTGRSVLVAALKSAVRPLLDLANGRSAASRPRQRRIALCLAVSHSHCRLCFYLQSVR